MVTVMDVVQRTNKEGEPFVALILQGDLEIVQSKEGNFYATAVLAPYFLDTFL